MQNPAHRHALLSPVISVASLISAVLGSTLFQQLGSIGTRIGLFLSIGIALVGILCGVAGFAGTRGERFVRRVPAVFGMTLGSLLALGYGFVLFLHMTPNAPF